MSPGAMTSPSFVTSTGDVFDQARSGSITAIIQVLNERLADVGVRTRAMVDGGLLQILCEASRAEQLDEATLAPQVQQILNELSPWGVRRVRLYSRIVQEQKLLWLKEVTGNPEQLLWTQEIRLNLPSLPRRLWGDWMRRRSKRQTRSLDRLRETEKQSSRLLGQRFWLSLALLAGVGGLALVSLTLGGDRLAALRRQPASVPPRTVGSATESGAAPEVASANDEAAEVETAADPFGMAVRIAEQAGKDGKLASSPAEWLDLAARWQKASELMAQVGEDDDRRQTAQDRVGVYKANSDAALKNAGK